MGRLAALAVVASAACGRIGFELHDDGALGDGGTGSGGDGGQAVANYVFVTATAVVPGSLGGLAGGDALCQAEAVNNHIPGTFVAWLSTSTTSAVSRLTGARGWKRLDGLPFADQAADIVTGRIAYPVAFDATGTRVADNLLVATGTMGSGAASLATCSGWTDPSSSNFAAIGFANTAPPLFTDINAGLPCNQPRPIYCFGTDLDLPLAFPNVAGRRAFVSASTLALNSTTSISSADAMCQADADAQGLGATFRALLATTTSSGASRFVETGVFVRTDGVPLASSASAFFDGNIDAPLSTLPDGSYVEAYVWTGAPVGATSLRVVGDSGSTCMDFSDPSGSAASQGASLGAHSLAFWFSNSIGCSNVLPVYCLEQ